MNTDTPPPEKPQEKVRLPANDPAAGGKPVPEVGGPPGPDPTRYGDWEVGGRCIDF
jgi:hypothetical protein